MSIKTDATRNYLFLKRVYDFLVMILLKLINENVHDK